MHLLQKEVQDVSRHQAVVNDGILSRLAAMEAQVQRLVDAFDDHFSGDLAQFVRIEVASALRSSSAHLVDQPPASCAVGGTSTTL